MVDFGGMNIANLAWVTVRKPTDLCTTTTRALAMGLCEHGHRLTLLAVEDLAERSSAPWDHIPLRQSKRRGFQGRSLAKSAAAWFRTQSEARDFDAVIVDWPLAPIVAPVVAALGIKLVLNDRSPPADAGVLARLQWRVWNRAWGMVTRGIIDCGSVVSTNHASFVTQQHGIEPDRLHVVPAGVDLDLFQPTIKTGKAPTRLVYHGRLDKNRGVLALPMLCQRLRTNGIDAQLTLIGDGNALSGLTALAQQHEWLTLLPKQPHRAMGTILAEHDVGLLPMPPNKVWSMASPLKLSEYMASGLLVLGVDHDGHRPPGAEQADWISLHAQSAFLEEGVRWLTQLTSDDLNDGQRRSRTYAELNCSWRHGVNAMVQMIQSVLVESS